MEVSLNGRTQQPWGFPTKNDHFGVFWGYHHFRKPPYPILYRVSIYIPGGWEWISEPSTIWLESINIFSHQKFQVPKMEVRKKLIFGYFGGWVFPSTSRKTYSLHRWVPSPKRYLKCLVIQGFTLPKTNILLMVQKCQTTTWDISNPVNTEDIYHINWWFLNHQQ